MDKFIGFDMDHKHTLACVRCPEAISQVESPQASRQIAQLADYQIVLRECKKDVAKIEKTGYDF